MKFYIAFVVASLLSACAAVNPNPNVGLRSVSIMLEGGNCAGAMEILRGAAERGEPWAELRLGYFAYTKQCPGVSIEEGNRWLAQTVCYEAKSAWERGEELSMGKSGFFNTRVESYNAIDVLQMAAEVSSPDVESMLVKKWYWINVGISLFEEDHPTRIKLDKKLGAIEENMSGSALQRAKDLNICGPIRQQVEPEEKG